MKKPIKKPTKKPIKRRSKSKLISELDTVFSRYIRKSHADGDGMVRCVTCNALDHWTKLQAGHFQSRKHFSTRWEEKNVSPQCVRCNVFNSGEQYLHGLYLDKKWGEGTAQEMEKLARQITHNTLDDYEGLIKYYKAKLANL